MEIKFNVTFKTLLDKFDLPIDLNFQIELPADVQYQIKDAQLQKIIIENEAQSFEEDFNNHFHVDESIDNITDKQAFELGVKALMTLAKRFQKENVSNIQLTYSFQTPEMGKVMANAYGIDDDEHYISDRLSFHTKRYGQTVVSEEMFENAHFAFLIIDL